MFIAASVLLFAIALGIFVYLFDNFMGESETDELARTMAALDDELAATKPVARSSRAAGSGA